MDIPLPDDPTVRREGSPTPDETVLEKEVFESEEIVNEAISEELDVLPSVDTKVEPEACDVEKPVEEFNSSFASDSDIDSPHNEDNSSSEAVPLNKDKSSSELSLHNDFNSSTDDASLNNENNSSDDASHRGGANSVDETLLPNESNSSFEAPEFHEDNSTTEVLLEAEIPDISETPLPQGESAVENTFMPMTVDFLEDIPVPADSDRYSPSLPNEDDPPELKPDLSSIALPAGQPKIPAPMPTVSVLGKEAAKKRLLAFSLTKQSQKKMKSTLESSGNKDINKDIEKNLPVKKKKKGVADKARNTISEIEEIKRQENEVRESMQMLYPMWGSDSKLPPVPSVYIPEGLEKAERVDIMAEKLAAKKALRDQKEQERLERLEREEREEERRKRREKREKERRMKASPKNWTEFTKRGYKAYHYRRVKSRRDKNSESKSRSHDREEKGSSKKINLLETPMVIKSPFIALSVCNDDLKFPSWSLKFTMTKPRLPYSFNPKEDRISCFISRKDMLNSLPDNIYHIVKTFFHTSCTHRIQREEKLTNRSWYVKDNFLLPSEKNIPKNEDNDGSVKEPVIESNVDPRESNVSTNQHGFEKQEKIVEYQIESPTGSSDENVSFYGKNEILGNTKDTATVEEKDENLATEYEEFIKTIEPNENINNREIKIEQINSENDWARISLPNSEEDQNNSEEKKDKKQKKVKKNKLKRAMNSKKKSSRKNKSHRSSSDSSSSDSSSSSSESSSESKSSSSSSSTSSSSSSSDSSSSSSDSSSSESSSSSSEDSSSESSSSSSSSDSSSSSADKKMSHKKKQSKKHVKKSPMKKKQLKLKEKNKSLLNAALKEEKTKKNIIKKDKSLTKKSQSLNEIFKKEDLNPHIALDDNSIHEESCSDGNNVNNDSERYEFHSKDDKQVDLNQHTNDIDLSKTSVNELDITEESFLPSKKDEIYEPKEDFSPQSSLGDETSKLNFSDTQNSYDPKDLDKSPVWDSLDEKESSKSHFSNNENLEKDIHSEDKESKRHFNLDIFQETHNNSLQNSNSLESKPVSDKLDESKHLEPKEEFKDYLVENSNVSIQHDESALKSLERYSPTAEDDEDDDEIAVNNTAVGGSTADDASQLVSFGVNSISQEARMLDIPLPPPIETPPSGAPLISFHNILQIPSSPPQTPSDPKGTNKNSDTFQSKSQVARLTFGKQVLKLKPTNIFSTEDSDSEMGSEKLPLPLSLSEENNSEKLSSINSNIHNMHVNTSEKLDTEKIADPKEENRNITELQDNDTNLVGQFELDTIPLQINSEISPLKRNRWDQESVTIDKVIYEKDISEFSKITNDRGNGATEKEKKQQPINVNSSEIKDKPKEKNRTTHNRSRSKDRDKRRRHERSYSKERDRGRRHRERTRDSRDRRRSPREKRRDSIKRSRSKDRGRRGSPCRDRSPSKKRHASPCQISRHSPDERHRKLAINSQISGNASLNHEFIYAEPTTTSDFKKDKESQKENIPSLLDNIDSSGRKNSADSPQRQFDSPKRKRSPGVSPYRSPLGSPIRRKTSESYRRKESPIRRRSPEVRRDLSPRRFSPRRSPLRRRPSPERRRLSPYSPRQFSPLSRRTPDRQRQLSPNRRKHSPSLEKHYSPRLKSPGKQRSYSISPSKDDNWKWQDQVPSPDDTDHFNKWDFENSQNTHVNDYQTGLADSTISDSELVKDAPSSPKRMSLDERLRLELGHSLEEKPPPPPPNQKPPYQQVQNLYYPPPSVLEGHVGNYFGPQVFNQSHSVIPDWKASMQQSSTHPNKLLQVGNVLQVVPNEIPVEQNIFQHPSVKEGKKADKPTGKNQVLRQMDSPITQVVQVGNVLQVVPTTKELPPPSPQKTATMMPDSPKADSPPPPPPVSAPEIPQVMVPPQSQPVSIISLPFPPGSPSVFRKIEEKERKKREKEMRKERKERKAARRQLRKAKLRQRASISNELDSELNMDEDLDVSAENIEIETNVSLLLPSPDKGIMRDSQGSSILKKKVSFADGIVPGEGTSPSGGEEHPLSPPPNRKPAKKRKKRKVKVRIIRIESNSKEEESEEDDLSPPPPPPGTPPPEAYQVTAAGRYLYPVTTQPFQGNQEGIQVYPPLPNSGTNPTGIVQFGNPPPSQQR